MENKLTLQLTQEDVDLATNARNQNPRTEMITKSCPLAQMCKRLDVPFHQITVDGNIYRRGENFTDIFLVGDENAKKVAGDFDSGETVTPCTVTFTW